MSNLLSDAGRVIPLTVVPSWPACECSQGHCRYRPSLVRLYLIAYREAIKCGDDPADYIRDYVRNSRDIDPWTRGGRTIDPQASLDIKLTLEIASGAHGIALNAWNADRLAAACCPLRWNESLAVDNE